MPSTSAAHDEPDCHIYTIFQNPSPEHYICAVTSGAGTALEPFLDFYQCMASANPLTVNIAYVIGCL